MQNNAQIAGELETAFKGLQLNEEVHLADILARWQEFAKELAAGPCVLTPTEFCLRIATSRHLLEVILEPVSAEAQTALKQACAAADSTFQAATLDLIHPLADEEGEPLWYLLRGPKAIAPEGEQELWDYYVGNTSPFSATQVEQLDALSHEICDDDQMGFLELLQYWKELVVTVEDGYDDVRQEFELDLWHSRGNLDQIVEALELPLQDQVKAVLAPWDKRFEAASREIELDEDSEMPEDAPILLSRVPLRFNLPEEELQDWMDA